MRAQIITRSDESVSVGKQLSLSLSDEKQLPPLSVARLSVSKALQLSARSLPAEMARDTQEPVVRPAEE